MIQNLLHSAAASKKTTNSCTDFKLNQIIYGHYVENIATVFEMSQQFMLFTESIMLDKLNVNKRVKWYCSKITKKKKSKTFAHSATILFLGSTNSKWGVFITMQNQWTQNSKRKKIEKFKLLVVIMRWIHAVKQAFRTNHFQCLEWNLKKQTNKNKCVWAAETKKTFKIELVPIFYTL